MFIIYIYIYIRHRAARHGRACSVHCQLSVVLCQFSFKGPTASQSGSTAWHVFITFRTIFSDMFVSHNWCQKVPNWEPQKNTKSHKSRQTPHQNALLIEACKKTPSGRGQTSEFDDSYTLSAVFSGAQGSEKGVEMELKWSLRAPQITKNQEKWALKKTWKNNTAKSGFVVEEGPQKWLPLSPGERLQNHKNPRYLENGSPGFQNEPQGP